MSWHDHRGYVPSKPIPAPTPIHDGLDPRVWQLSEDGQFWEMIPSVIPLYKACINKQLAEWVKGNNVHTTDLPPGIESECCPDMACCNPNNAWSLEMRQQFIDANEEDRMRMCMSGLSQLFEQIFSKEDESVSVYIAGTVEESSHQ